MITVHPYNGNRPHLSGLLADCEHHAPKIGPMIEALYTHLSISTDGRKAEIRQSKCGHNSWGLYIGRLEFHFRIVKDDGGDYDRIEIYDRWQRHGIEPLRVLHDTQDCRAWARSFGHRFSRAGILLARDQAAAA